MADAGRSSPTSSRRSWRTRIGVDVLRGTFVPHVADREGVLLTLVAMLGTTISPYLFFWQAAQKAEEDEHLTAEAGNRPRRSITRELRSVRSDGSPG